MRNIPTNELLQELQKRGYRTDLVIGIEKIDDELKEINQTISTPIKLSLKDKESILESLSLEWHKQEIKDEIIEKILSIVKENE
jgi:hypothetical protein